MSLQSQNDLDFEIEQIKEMQAERNVSFGDALTMWNAGVRPTPISDTTRRYWSDPAYAARLDAERDAVNARYFAAHDARSRALREAMWADEDLPDMELRA